MSPPTELKERLAARREDRGLELKGPLSWADRATQGKVVRAVLAMANRADGGILAFGYDSPADNPLHELVGLTTEQSNSFNQDSVTSTVNTHCVPYVDLTVEHLDIDGKLVVALVIRPFADYPVICSKDFVVDGKPIVTKGKLYCRSRRTPESTEVQAPEDMRDIIELATSRGIDRYFRLRALESAHATPSGEQRFTDELGDLSS